MPATLTPDQSAALSAILAFLSSNEQFFTLSGYAGTGKTFCIRELVNRTKGRFVFTAPTNKATKVLRESVTSKDYKPECRTIFSLLGLRLEASGEVKELTAPEDPIDLSQFKAVIVDEGSMVNANLFRHIKLTANTFGVKFIFLGDPAQLPPVGELRSPIWALPNKAELTKVLRHDNQILDLATRIREVVDRPAPSISLVSAHSDDEGVWKADGPEFTNRIISEALAGGFSEPNQAKAIAWRNSRVDELNKLIRGKIFPAVTSPWCRGDRVIFTAPAKDLDDEPAATTDDEGTIESIETEFHAFYPEFKIWRISITLDDNRPVIARVLHEDYLLAFNRKAAELSDAAKRNGRLWKKFWAFKEAFHSLRHAYAITAHRAQGSTYDMAFVDWRDILLNKNRQEAFRCLYVACTRPKRALILG